MGKIAKGLFREDRFREERFWGEDRHLNVPGYVVGAEEGAKYGVVRSSVGGSAVNDLARWASVTTGNFRVFQVANDDCRVVASRGTVANAPTPVDPFGTSYSPAIIPDTVKWRGLGVDVRKAFRGQG